MKHLKIQNNGELDIRLVALMGGSTKTKDRYKIGKFGTGLKYTLAFLFRNNLAFKIFSGETLIDVSIEEEVIKEEVFEIICINKNRTSITTKMGLDWSAWMILRELWCNALDEGGELKEARYLEEEELIGKIDTTTFYIQINEELNEVLDNWGNYFLHREEPMFENEDYGIYENDGKLKLYKQGVLIYQHPEVVSLFKYDIKNAEINELREFKGMVSLEVFNALRNPNTEVVSYFLAHVKESHFEGTELDYDWFSSFCEIWKTTIGESKVGYYRSDSERSESNKSADNMSDVIKLPKKIYKALTKSFEGIGAVGTSDKKHEFYSVKNDFLTKRIEDLILNLISKGYEIDLSIKFETGVFDDKIKAGTNRKKNTVLISNICIDIPDFDLACILIEQITLLKNQDRELKNIFLCKYVNRFIVAEEKIEEVS